MLIAARSSMPALGHAQHAQSGASAARVRLWLVAAHRIEWEPGTSWCGSLAVGRYVPNRLGVEVGLSYAGPAGFYDFTGAVLDAGATYTVPLHPVFLGLSAGASGILGGDLDSTGAATGGG
jgi:hypothetical protein